MALPVINIFAVPEYEKQIIHAAELLGRGALVVLPTETVYGAAGVLTQESARMKLRQLRPQADKQPFIVHLADRHDAAKFLGPVSDLARRMMKKLWPGPVGIMFEVPPERQKQVAGELNLPESDLYEDGFITLRCPDHPVAYDVLSQQPEPVAITRAGSANGLSPAQLSVELDGKVELILDAGPTQFAKPSTLLKVTGDKYQIVRIGVYDERIIERLLRTTILFVCSGNTCRSPMSEAIARHLLAVRFGISELELENKGISVGSAGSFAVPGARATLQAVDAVKALGADLSRHRSRPLTVELIHEADHIFAMSRGHARAVLSLVPSAADKVDTLDPDQDIEDPIGGDSALYVELAAHLQNLIDRRLSETLYSENQESEAEAAAKQTAAPETHL